MRKLFLRPLLLVGLVSCAGPVEKGLTAFNSGNYDAAAKNWQAGAKAGNMHAQHNLGLLAERGLGSTPQDSNRAAEWYLKAAQQGYIPSMVALARIQLSLGNKEPAISWLTLAARWNNPEATALLRDLGLNPPSPDLFVAQQHAQAQAAYAVGCAIAGGCAPTAPSANAKTSFTPSNALQTEWYEGGTKRCRYEDGIVLTVERGVCPPFVSAR